MPWAWAMLHMIAGVTAAPRWQWSSARGTFRDSVRAIWPEDRRSRGVIVGARATSVQAVRRRLERRGTRAERGTFVRLHGFRIPGTVPADHGCRVARGDAAAGARRTT